MDCYDYERHVLWNAWSTELFRRTVIKVNRQLRKKAPKRLKSQRAQYAKVAEFQKRGVIHFHVLLRHDDRRIDYSDLESAVRYAARTTSIRLLNDSTVGWGEQLDIRRIVCGDGDGPSEGHVTRGRVAGYIAKYATKGTESLGRLDRRITPGELSTLRVNAHVRRLVETAFRLAPEHRESGPRKADLRLGSWAHQLGFRGHFLTKSHGYSTTFTALRQARVEYRRKLEAASWDALHPDTRELIILRWEYVGRGYRNTRQHRAAEQYRDSQASAA